MTAERRPWIAAGLSLVLPGLGHLYVGRPAAGVAASLLGVLAIVLLYVGAVWIPLAPLNVALPVLMIPLVWVGVPVHAALIARRVGSDYTLKPYNRWYIYAGLYSVLGVLVYPALPDFLRTHFVEAFRIPSGAMEPTTQIGDFLYVAKWPEDQRRPAHGRIVVFEAVDEPGLKVMKRVLGMPGDTLSMRSGELSRNGHLVPEPYVVHTDPRRSEGPIQRAKMREWQIQHLANPASEYAPDIQDWGPIVVPVDSFFGLGDNRDASYDSRYYGFAPFAGVIGRPTVIYLSLGPKSNGALLSRVRWKRIGQKVQ